MLDSLLKEIDFLFLPFIFSLCGVGVIQLIKNYVEKLLLKKENLIKIFEEFVYPALTVGIGVGLAFLKPIQHNGENIKFAANLMLYIGISFINYKYIFKIAVNKVIEKIKKLK